MSPSFVNPGFPGVSLSEFLPRYEFHAYALAGSRSRSAYVSPDPGLNPLYRGSKENNRSKRSECLPRSRHYSQLVDGSDPLSSSSCLKVKLHGEPTRCQALRRVLFLHYLI